jgi:hypothetical protein
MDALATVADVAAALGLGLDADALTEEQQARAIPLLAKVSRRFRLEAQRRFTPGTYTHYLKIFAGAVRLEEIPSEVISVEVPGVDDVSYSLVQNWITFDDYWLPEYTGKTAAVTYKWTALVPADVVATVADIVARNLTVDPNSVVAQSKALTAGRQYSQDVADWVSTGQVGMNDDDIMVAKSYRYPAPPSIVLHP